MANAIELIAKLGAKTQSWNQRIDGFADLSELLRGMDIALALQGLSRGPSFFAMVAWGGMTAVLPDLERELLMISADFAYANKLKPRKGLMLGLCRAAIAEGVTPKVCPVCGGREIEGVTIVLVDGVAHKCESCAGSGIGRWRNEERRQLARLTHEEWISWERPVYTKLVETLQDWSCDAYRHVMAKIGEGER